MDLLFNNSFESLDKFVNKLLSPVNENWSRKRDLNSQHPAWRAGALPVELLRHTCNVFILVTALSTFAKVNVSLNIQSQQLVVFLVSLRQEL